MADVVKNHFYHDPKVTDIETMKLDAQKKLANGDTTIIHHHKHGELCKNRTHDEFFWES